MKVKKQSIKNNILRAYKDFIFFQIVYTDDLFIWILFCYQREN